MDTAVQAVLDGFHERMRRERSARERGDRPGDWRDHSLLAVGPDTGRLLNIMAGALDRPRILEIGTSFGYSTVWLAEAARGAGGRVVTIEQAEHKSRSARGSLADAGLLDRVDLRVGDALSIIGELEGEFDLVLLDLWKDLYVPCLDLFFPKLAPGAIVVADNMVRPGGEDAARYRAAIGARPGVTSVLLPVGTGLEVSRLAS